jgi:uncharacterized repeat protein (TIGR03803 family)
MGEERRNREWMYRARHQMLSAILAFATCVLMVLATRPTRAQTPSERPTYTVIYNFTGGADGGYPVAGLIRDAAGNLYGTAAAGGTPSFCADVVYPGCGVVFKLDPQGNETVLYTFTGGADGAFPSAGLIRDAAGNLYGTTTGGGTYGGGVVFKLSPAGVETVLHTFTGGSDGSTPSGGLIRDAVGNLYGATSYAGTAHNCGTVFKLEPSGKETVLHAFTCLADGAIPSAGLIRDAAGNLYGTTLGGGSGDCYWGGCGVVFKIDPSGTESVLYSFTGGDGGSPYAGLVRDATGNLYGTTLYGGSSSLCNWAYGCGVVFKLDPSGRETVLHAFTGGADGGQPRAGLILDALGNLAGTTDGGATDFGGVVFKVDQKGHETVLYDFCSQSNCVDGQAPYAGLLRDRASHVYGTTYWGGTYGAGVVFKLSPP